MGWDGSQITHWKNGRPDIIAEYNDRFRDYGDFKCPLEPVKSVAKGSVIYSAVRNKNTGQVFGEVALTSKDGSYLMFKEISEAELPYYYDCPKSILNLLSPTEDENSLKWREECIKYQEEKKTNPVYLQNSKVGDMIIFNKEKILVHSAPMAQFKTDFWKEYGQYKYVNKKLVTPQSAVPYTRDNLEKCFIYKLCEIASKELYHGLPNLIKNDNKVELPYIYTNLFLNTDDPKNFMSSLVLRMVDGKAVFTTDYEDIQYDKESLSDVCKASVEVLEQKYAEYVKNVNKEDVEKFENTLEELEEEQER